MLFMENSSYLVPIGSTGKLQNNIALPYQFTISGVIKESWHRVKGTKITYWGAILICLAIYAALSFLGGVSIVLYGQYVNPNDLKPPFILSRVIITLITLPLPFGLTLLALRRSVNLPIKIKQIVEPYRCYWKILAVMIVLYAGIAIIIVATLFASISVTNYMSNMTPTWLRYYPHLIQILGALIAIYFVYSLVNAPLLIIEKQLGVLPAIKASMLAFIQHGFKIILTVACLIVICFISLLPLGIGLIWTLPMLYNCMGILYRIQFGVEEQSN